MAFPSLTAHARTLELIGDIVKQAVSGLPFTPSASQVVPVAWDAGANKIFKL